MTNEAYTTQLGAGQGIVEESRLLLSLWEPGMDANSLHQAALHSGLFPSLTARRLRNLVVEGFAPRFLVEGDMPSCYLRKLFGAIPDREMDQLFFIYTCRAHRVLADYVREVFWKEYSSGKPTISNEQSMAFVLRAIQDGKTTKAWSESMISRVAGYLNGTLANFGLLEEGRKSERKFIPYRMFSSVIVYLAYDLHFAGYGDNSVLSHPDWKLFGLEREEVSNELKRLALNGWWIFQSAGTATKIGWKYPSMEDVLDGLIRG